jgi:hypothetical protein
MCNMLQRIDLRRKKTLHATEKHTERIQQMRVDYWNIIKDVKPENCNHSHPLSKAFSEKKIK